MVYWVFFWRIVSGSAGYDECDEVCVEVGLVRNRKFRGIFFLGLDEGIDEKYLNSAPGRKLTGLWLALADSASNQ